MIDEVGGGMFRWFAVYKDRRSPAGWRFEEFSG
jgi:hypothetical protein